MGGGLNLLHATNIIINVKCEIHYRSAIKRLAVTMPLSHKNDTTPLDNPNRSFLMPELLC